MTCKLACLLNHLEAMNQQQARGQQHGNTCRNKAATRQHEALCHMRLETKACHRDACKRGMELASSVDEGLARGSRRQRVKGGGLTS